MSSYNPMSVGSGRLIAQRRGFVARLSGGTVEALLVVISRTLLFIMPLLDCGMSYFMRSLGPGPRTTHFCDVWVLPTATEASIDLEDVGTLSEGTFMSSRIKCNTVQRCCDGKKKI